MTFLQSLERGDHLFARSIAARPQPQLPPARCFEHWQLDPELGDRRAWLPLLDPWADEPKQLGGARERMADDRVTLVMLIRFVDEPHPHTLRARAAQSQLRGKVAAESASDKEERFSILDRRLELAMHAREQRRAPRSELIRFRTAREQDSMPAGATELALQLPGADRGHGAQGAQAEQVEPFQLLFIKWKLTRSKWGEESPWVIDLHETTWSRAGRRHPC